MMDKQILYTNINNIDLVCGTMVVDNENYFLAMRKETIELLKNSEISINNNKILINNNEQHVLYIDGAYVQLLTSNEKIIEKLFRIHMKSSYSLQDLIDNVIDESIDLNISTMEVKRQIFKLIKNYLY